MSFRETRNLTEMLRSLGFPRQVSLENFRAPNFDLVAELLRWLAARFDPTFEIPFDTDSESERVLFIKAVVEFLATKAHVKLNAKKLYSADLACVRELLKATSLLYSAIRPSAQQEGDDGVQVTRTDFDLSDRLHDLKQTRQLASEITQRGATLFDLLGREVDLRVRGADTDRNHGLLMALSFVICETFLVHVTMAGGTQRGSCSALGDWDH
eukprot:m.224277 g.224277  ORF g.224277 m.224277 type:complete len:212 (-) comp18768_c0_seq4:2346-2981(-)